MPKTAIYITICCAALALCSSCAEKIESVTVGILFSDLAEAGPAERAAFDATLRAIDEVNERGGVLGRAVHPLFGDSLFCAMSYARAAERLISRENASVIFGCWTSASRKEVKPVIEMHNAILFYPAPYEGLEKSAHIIYTGALPNQHILPALEWSYAHLGVKWYLVGSDDIYSRITHEIIKDNAEALGAVVLGEFFLGAAEEVGGSTCNINSLRPDVVLSTLAGGEHDAFISLFRPLQLAASRPAILSFRTLETEYRDEKGQYRNYLSRSYIPSLENEVHKNALASKYAAEESAEMSVLLWANAVNESGSFDPNRVREVLKCATHRHGCVLDETNNHTWHYMRIVRVNAGKGEDILWSSGEPLCPIPFPQNRYTFEWHTMLQKLHERWGAQWTSPGN